MWQDGTSPGQALTHQRLHRSLGRNVPPQAFATGSKAIPNLPPVDNAWIIHQDQADKCSEA